MKKKHLELQNLKPWAQVELITPELAEKFLKKNLRNRPLQQHDVLNYTKEIEKDHWFVTNNGIGFAEDGSLMDGQHRLNAIVKSGKAQEMVVVRNIKKEAFSVIDTGRKRRLEDVLAIEGYKNWIVVAGTARMGLALTRDMEEKAQSSFRGRTKHSIDDLLQYTKSQPDISSSVTFALHKYKTLIKICSYPATIGCYHLFSQKDPELALEMFNLLETGAIGDENNVILHCRNILIAHKQAELKLNTRSSNVGYLAFLLVRTWNALREGVRDIRMIQDGTKILRDYTSPIPIIK